jgi:hypothetical protein
LVIVKEAGSSEENSAFHKNADKPKRRGGLQVCYLCGFWRYRFGWSSSLLFMPSRLSNFAIKYREFRKFLAGAFFVSSGTCWYLWATGVSLPIVLPYVGTISIETPDISGQRAIVHVVLFLLCFYFGFISKPKGHESTA